MKVLYINPFLNFKGQRQDRKTIAQLKQDNPYDLNVINQRRINQAIENLSEIEGEDNVDFLLDVSENLKYGTNIDNGKTSYNEWRVKLNEAAKRSLAKSPKSVQEKYSQRIANASKKKELSQSEKEILKIKDELLSKIDQDELKKISSNNIKNLNNNLDYFIISSEVPTAQKLYIMKKLNYFMSPEYTINEQLKNKKTQVLAEIVNDIVVETPESKIPNIKATDQKQHGMCAAISICRKALAYEDKANFVDMILSELDNNPELEVYDIRKLGSHTKTKIPKTALNFDYALSRGYRIIDTSALYWMHVADTDIAKNEKTGMFYTFDDTFFDTFHDSHLLPDLAGDTAIEQDYYRALLKSKNSIEAVKKAKLIKKYKDHQRSLNIEKDIKQSAQANKKLEKLLQEISPELSNQQSRQVILELKKLEVKNSEAAQKVSDYTKDFVYLPNENIGSKLEKIKAFLAVALEQKDAKKLNKNAPEILEYLTIINDTSKDSKVSDEAKRIRHAQSLYNAAAAYRTQCQFRMEIQEELNDLLMNSEIPDRETRIADNMEQLIAKLNKEIEAKEKGKKLNKRNHISNEIKETLARNFQTENDPEILIAALSENKESLDYIMTDLLDDFYALCLSVSRKYVLKEEIKILKNNIDKNDPETILTLSKNLKMEPNAGEISELLDGYIAILESEDCTNDDYIGIYNSIGKKNQMKDFAQTFEHLGQALFQDKDKNLIEGFNKINGLKPDAPIEDTYTAYNNLAQKFNNVSLMITSLQNALEVRNNDGEILNTVIDKEILMKQLENIGEVIPAKDLKALQNRFNKIYKMKSEENGQSVKYKDLPKELTTFDKHEKEILKQIENNINGWHKQTTRALNLEYNKIKEPLSELNRKVGVRTGQPWVFKEGDSGLWDFQQIKIFEHMTDRPYYSEANTKFALQKIKNGAYSGISGSSVDDKEPAFHAQYIVDIKPVQVKTIKGETRTKEALFHDNTWGPSEHENVWVDKNGLLRTDYSRGYGGEIGYITDEKYRTGKFIDNLIGKVGVMKPEVIDSKAYKKLAGARHGEVKYPMFYQVITPGKNPNSSDYVKMIRQNTLISSTLFFDDFEEMAKKMTREQVKELIKKTKNIGDNIYVQYKDIDNRINGNPPFNKGIRTKADYDKLSDEDPLKILFEKLALLKSYSDIPDSKIFYHEYSMEEISKLRNNIRKEALKNFEYSFGKNREIAIYGTERSRKMLNAVLTNFAQEHNIKLTPSDKVKIINSLKKVNAKDFDGSLNKTVSLMAESFEKYLTAHTPDFENKSEAINLLTQDVRNYLKTNMTFTLKDMSSNEFNSAKVQNIAKWIDKNFDPKTDEEFVEIFNMLQNMTTKEFNKKYAHTITDEAIGFKPITGYDVLTQYRSLDERTQDSVFNMLYYQKLGYDINLSNTKPEYEYKKFERVLRGAIYEKGQRTFDDLYFDYYYSLCSLTLQDKYKNLRTEAFKKYGAFPAYPILETEDQNQLAVIIQDFYKDIDESIDAIKAYKEQEKSIEIVSKLNKYISELRENVIVHHVQKEYIDSLITEFVSINGEDESIKDTLNAAYEILELPERTKTKEYKKLIKKMKDEFDMYSTTPDGKTMDDSVKLELKKLNDRKREFVLNTFAPKYQKTANQLLNKYISAKMKNSKDANKIFEEDFTMLYDKHRITKTPQTILNEYILMLAKPDENSKPVDTKAHLKKLEENLDALEENKGDIEEIEKIKKEISVLREKDTVLSTYSGHVKNLIDCANTLDLEYILMDCAKQANLNIVQDEFKKSTIKLKNGQIVTMDSEEAVNMIFMPLIIGDNLELTLKLTDQLGMNEDVAKMVMKSSKLDNVKKFIKRIDNIYSAVSSQTASAQEEFKKLGDIDNDPNYKEKIEKFRATMLKKCQQTNYSITKKIFNKAIDKALEEFEKYPDHSKSALLYVNLDLAKHASLYQASEDVESLNSQLMRFQHIVNFARKLQVPENTQTYTQFQEFLQKLNELEDYAQANTGRYDNIGMTTTATDIMD